MIICMRHREYKGQRAPELSCDRCCKIFISECQRRHKSGESLPAVWHFPRQHAVTRSEHKHGDDVIWLNPQKHNETFAQVAPHCR
ncbi:MAG: hypothetical protein OXT67_07680 [Zetaproteobacteria bacterium]|nr:hypothetical protein [Zetaproteobacteria bacterium]